MNTPLFMNIQDGFHPWPFQLSSIQRISSDDLIDDQVARAGNQSIDDVKNSNDTVPASVKGKERESFRKVKQSMNAWEWKGSSIKAWQRNFVSHVSIHIPERVYDTSGSWWIRGVSFPRHISLGITIHSTRQTELTNSPILEPRLWIHGIFLETSPIRTRLSLSWIPVQEQKQGSRVETRQE